MIQRKELEEVLWFISRHWGKVIQDPQNKAMQGLPDRFWMNSLGGKAGKGFWVTTIMYTEDQQFADTFKDILMRWQSNGKQNSAQSDLIQIKK